MADFTLTAAPVQQGLFSPSSFETKPVPVVHVEDKRQQTLFTETVMDFDTCKKTPGLLEKIDQAQHDYMRDVMPPIPARNCFAMGEPYSHVRGEPWYYWTGKIGHDFYIVFGSKEMAEAAFRKHDNPLMNPAMYVPVPAGLAAGSRTMTSGTVRRSIGLAPSKVWGKP